MRFEVIASAKTTENGQTKFDFSRVMVSKVSAGTYAIVGEGNAANAGGTTFAVLITEEAGGVGSAGGGVPFGGVMFYTESRNLLYASGLGNENIIYTISNSNISEFQQSLKTLNIKSSPLTVEQAHLLANVYSNNSYNVMAGYGYVRSKYTFGYINAPWYMYVGATAAVIWESYYFGRRGIPIDREYNVSHSINTYFGLKKFEPWW